MKVYYRLSNLEAGISKKKIPNATKQYCLENCINEFGLENITIIGDRLNNETKLYVNSLNLRLIEADNGSVAGTFRDALNLSIKENNDSDFVYLLEDDFLHKPNSKNLLIEGLNKYNGYLTLYDHQDKYLNKENGGNPFIEQEGEVTRLVKTPSVHWKITNSTVMSFACKVSRLKEDYDLILKYSSAHITDSFRFFTDVGFPNKAMSVFLDIILSLKSIINLSICFCSPPFRICCKISLKNSPNIGGKFAFLNSSPLISSDSLAIPSCFVIH